MRINYISVKNQYDDLHCYPNAPEEVAYLKSLHRHTFFIESIIQVFHEDRELEFYMVKDFIDTLIPELRMVSDNKSCENIGNIILTKLQEKYGANRRIQVEVSEDGRNKAIVTEEG